MQEEPGHIEEELIWVVETRDRLDKFLAIQLDGYSRSRLAREIEAGHVMVDGTVITKSAFDLRPGMSVEVHDLAELEPHDLTPVEMDLDVLFEDEAMMVINKPRGLATHPASSLKEPSLVNALLGRGGALSDGSATFRPGIVHRLDKPTTGLLMVAKTDFAHKVLASQIQNKEAERLYVAVVRGDPASKSFHIDAPIARDTNNRLVMRVDPAGRPAVTHICVLRRLEIGSLLVCRLETGRTHQIRVHLKAIGHPLIGDSLYAQPEHRDGPLQLHAVRLRFKHPISGAEMTIFCPPPEDFIGREFVNPDLPVPA